MSEASLSLASALAERPDAAALVERDLTLSWRELAARAAGLARELEARGAVREADSPEAPATIAEAIARGRPIVPVALVAEHGLATSIALHALVAYGIPALLIHPRSVAAERRALLARVGAAEIGHDELAAMVARIGPGADPCTIPVVPDDERALAIIHTSGSTGAPKAVVLSRRAFAASGRASAANLGWRPDDRWLASMPLCHVGGLSVLMRCLAARAGVVLAEPGSTEAIVEAIGRHRVTLASLVPTQLDRLLAREPRWQAPRHLRAVLIGGARASPGLMREARERGLPVLATYGLTEACSQVATQEPGGHVHAGNDAGRPLPGMEVRIRDGMIELRGEALFTHYLPGEDPGRTPDGWFRTGDMGRLDAHGRLHVLGRLQEIIVTGGETVHAGEIEHALEACPGVQAACVFGLPDPTWGERIAAAVVGTTSVERIRAHLEATLASFKHPRHIVLVPELPRLASGKVDRPALARAVGLRQTG